MLPVSMRCQFIHFCQIVLGGTKAKPSEELVVGEVEGEEDGVAVGEASSAMVREDVRRRGL
jgi:hypothetical protein